MQNENYPESEHLSNPPLATAHLGAAVIALRRRANGQLSASHTRRLLAVADGLETLLPAIERLEQVCEVSHV